MVSKTTIILQIKMSDNEDGDINCSQYSECCWAFTTLKGPDNGSGYHPISGNRQLGFTNASTGIEIYTKGADRASKW